MPFFYCHDEACEEFDHPQWTDGDVDTATCGACKKRSGGGRPKVPPVVARKQALAKKGGNVALPGSGSRQLFYCQNPAQSGDSTGVGIALALFDAMNLMFFVSRNDCKAAAAYLTYYSDIAQSTSRIVLVVGDEDAVPRRQRDEQLNNKRKQDAQKLRETEDKLRQNLAKVPKPDGLQILTLAEFTGLLMDYGWPITPLIVPTRLVPARLPALTREWAAIDYGTALEPLEWELETVELLRNDAAVRLRQVQEESEKLDLELLSSEPDLAKIEKALQRMRNENRLSKEDLDQAERVQQGVAAGLTAVRQRDARATAAWLGQDVRNLLSRLQALGSYGLFAVTPDDNTFLLVIAQDAHEAKQAATAAGGNAFSGALTTQCLAAPTETKRSRQQRFGWVSTIIDIRNNWRRDDAKALDDAYEKALQSAQPIKPLVGRIVPWMGAWERAGNQLYQDLTGLAVGLRDAIVAKKVEDQEALEDKYGAYQTIMRVGSYEYYPIGDTSRNILALLQRDGLKALTAQLYGKLAPGRAIVAKGGKGVLLDPLVKQHEPSAGKRRLTFVLIWVRGLNPAEMTAVANIKMVKDAVEDKQKDKINQAKRNPHHVMTAQLATQLMSLCAFYNESDQDSPDPARYFVPIPIGDPIRYDQYDPSGDFFLKPDDTNLIEYWKKKGLAESVGGAHYRYRQLCAITELFNSAEVDVIQIGIRSGALEQGMYQGMPTIYIEEHFCTTGDRMASLTWEGPARAQIDGIYRALKCDTEEQRKAIIELRAEIDADVAAGKEPKLPASEVLAPFQKELGAIMELYRQILARPIYDSKPEKGDPPQPLGGIYPPSPSPARRGFPHFYRLITRHLVGLNQARSREAAVAYKTWFEQVIRRLQPDNDVDARVYRGGLALDEVATLTGYMRRICSDYKNLRTRIASMPPAQDVEVQREPLTPREVIGIRNTFNQCYVNAALQLCATLGLDASYYVGNGQRFDELFAAPVSAFLTQMANEAQQGTYEELAACGNVAIVFTTQNTVELRKGLANKCGWNTIDRQEDAAEALTKILESFDVNRGLDASPAGLGLLTAEAFAQQSPSQMHFVVEVTTTYDVSDEGTVDNPAPDETWLQLEDDGRLIQRQVHNMLQLSLDDTQRTLAAVLARNQDRVYADELETSRCICRGRYHPAAARVREQQRFVFPLPQLVVVLLKRFTSRGDKIATLVTDTAAVVLDGGNYTLVSFVVHIGETMRGGHYIAYRREGGHWYEVDDNTVTLDPAAVDAQAQNAYVLLYRRQA